MLGIASRNEDKYSGRTINTAPDNQEASTNQSTAQHQTMLNTREETTQDHIGCKQQLQLTQVSVEDSRTRGRWSKWGENAWS